MPANVHCRVTRRGTKERLVPALLIVLIVLLLGLQGAAPRGYPASKSVAGVQSASTKLSRFANLPIAFEANGGQADPHVHFIAHNHARTLLFKTDGLTLLMASAPQRGNGNGNGKPAPAASVTELGLEFDGASQAARLQGGETLPGTVSYMTGNDPARWHTGLPTFKSLTYSGLYPGIDLQYAGTSGQLEGTYTIAPGAEPASIRWRYTGAGAIRIDPSGNLTISVGSTPNPGGAGATLTEFAPVAWQQGGGERIPVAAQYVVYGDQSIGFRVSTYDAHRPLIIDPTMAFSTFLGGSQSDDGIGIAVDGNGNTYVSGSTSSADFPSVNPLQPSFGGGIDAFVTKINAAGTALVYSTYLGGSGEEESWGIAVDSLGSAYVSGWTNSTDFPTANPYQPAKSGERDAFVAKLNPAGTALVYSTYLGGSQNDRSWDLAVNGGYAYVTGETESTDFPTSNAMQPTNHGGKDIFVTKLGLSGTSLVYSSYLGGSGDDVALCAVTSAGGDLYVAGGSYSTDYPVSMAYQPTNRGGEDAVVSKFNSTGSALVYSTYLGGNQDEIAWGVDLSPQGDAYVAGDTSSTDFPTRRAVQSVKGYAEDGFVTRLAPSGSWIVYSTYLGGNGQYDAPYGIAVDQEGRAFVSSLVNATDFPVVNPIQPTYGGNVDAAVSMFSPLGAPLLFSTYLGGTGEDFGWRAAVDGQGNIYSTGLTRSSDFPTSMPLQPSIAGESDAFVVKITGLPGPTPSPVPCTVSFSDVPTGSTFYPYVRCLACEGIVTGYDDGTFRPDNPISRGELAKIASKAAGFNDPPIGQHFEDVPPGSPFHPYIERLALRGVVSGYPCGGGVPPGSEPCVPPQNRPYFRWGANVTRSQAAKIVATTAAFPDPANGEQRFADVPITNTFYRWVQIVASQSLVSGYPCGGGVPPGSEPCVPPQNLPYFRPANNVTRGQAAKIVANTFLAECAQGEPGVGR